MSFALKMLLEREYGMPIEIQSKMKEVKTKWQKQREHLHSHLELGKLT